MKHYEREPVARLLDTAKALLNTNRTFHDIYEMTMNSHGKNISTIYFDEDDKRYEYNYEQYKTITYHLAERMATALSSVPVGSVVALKLRNCPTWPHMFWAILMTGHTPLLIDAKLPHENTENLLKQAKAKAIIFNEATSYSVPSFRTSKITQSEPNYNFTPSWGNEVIFCSSGTTGNVKMMVSDGNAMCNQIAAALDMPNETCTIMHPGKIRNLAMIPFHHIFGFVAVFLWYTFYGKALVYPSSSSNRDVLNAIKIGRCTHIYSVPLFWDAVAQKAQRTIELGNPKNADLLRRMIAYNTGKISKEEAGFASFNFIQNMLRKKILGKDVEYCISGGGYLNAKTLNFINGLGYPLYNGYGMTELGVVSVELSPRVEDRLRGSIGHPLHGVTFKLKSIPGGGKGQGELLVKTPTIHIREIIGGEERETPLDDGYFHTGDIAEKDSTGAYYIKGRMKDVIINSNGENVYPDEIEFYFHNIRHVVNDVVLGIKKKDSSEEDITLIFELDNSVTSDDFPSIIADAKTINATLANEKKVQRFLIYKHSMPLANNMKVKRFVLKDALEKGDMDDFYDPEGNVTQKKKASRHFSRYDQKEVERITKGVKNEFASTLMIPLFKIDDEADFGRDLGGDSMSYITLVEDINRSFKVTIPVNLYGRLLTVNDFVEEILLLLHPENEKER
mgnify:FL=1